ncbi:hypothetical protein [Dongshaea marina]|uniref:hypothetical protein n=1 Tax=Dongshaea marina TaxID=2047966 RepID=UPI000D3ED37B|nr:hypothetical protein [Dongshaea marina]
MDNAECARDEYRSYVPDVMQLVSENAGAERIAKYLEWVAAEQIGLPTADGFALGIAEKLIAASQGNRCRVGKP